MLDRCLGHAAENLPLPAHVSDEPSNLLEETRTILVGTGGSGAKQEETQNQTLEVWGQAHIRTEKMEGGPPPPRSNPPPFQTPPSPSSNAGESLSWGPGKFFTLTVSGAT